MPPSNDVGTGLIDLTLPITVRASGDSGSALKRFLRAGVSDDIPMLDQYSIVITNIGFAIAQGTNLLLLIGTPILLGHVHWVPSAVIVLAILLYSMSYALIARRQYFSGRLLFSASLVVTVSSLTILFGTPSALQYLFLPIIIGALMIWPEQRVAQLGLASSAFAAFLVMSIVEPAGFLQQQEQAALVEAHVPLINVSLAFLVTFVVVLFLVVTSEKLQRLLDKSRLKAVEKSIQREEQLLSTLNALALARDNETGNHVLRTQFYVKTLARRLAAMGLFTDQLDADAIDLLFKAAPLHDVGKIGIADKILLKPGKFDSEEWEIMKTHTTIGESVLTSAVAQARHDGLDAHEDIISVAIKVAGGHHERWDGTGYPRGLKGEAVPLEARIMAVADTYDALTSRRPYKREWTHEQAIEDIVAGAGTRFDPDVITAFVAEKDRFQEIARLHKD